MWVTPPPRAKSSCCNTLCNDGIPMHLSEFALSLSSKSCLYDGPQVHRCCDGANGPNGLTVPDCSVTLGCYDHPAISSAAGLVMSQRCVATAEVERGQPP